MPTHDATRIGVLSDSHHDHRAIEKAMGLLALGGPLDAVCFLGDCTVDAAVIEPTLGKAKLYVVRGNNDLLSSDPDEMVVALGGKRFLLTHGHLHRVKIHRLQLLLAAQQAEADIALFGHTHQPECGYEQGVLLFNPGACSGYGATCGLITVEHGILRADILSL